LFQNNWDKKVHMLENIDVFWKTMGFLGKQCCFFLKAMFFYTTSHMIYFDYKAYAFYQNTVKLHVLHKLSFHNTILHRSHSLIGHVIQEL